MNLLDHVHIQRIASAAQLIAAGHDLTLRVDGSDDSAYLVFQEHRTRRVIASGSQCGMERLLPEAQAELVRQLHEIELVKGARCGSGLGALQTLRAGVTL